MTEPFERGTFNPLGRKSCVHSTTRIFLQCASNHPTTHGSHSISRIHLTENEINRCHFHCSLPAAQGARRKGSEAFDAFHSYFTELCEHLSVVVARRRSLIFLSRQQGKGLSRGQRAAWCAALLNSGQQLLCNTKPLQALSFVSYTLND